MCELAWMKYFLLKSNSKQPLADPNGEMSPSSGISSANACMRRQTTELNQGVVTLIRCI